MKGAAAQSQMIYYSDVFGGFAKNEADACRRAGLQQVRGQGRRHRGR